MIRLVWLPRRLVPAGVLAALLALGGCGEETVAPGACTLPADGTVLAIGDSITRGYGAAGQGYPEQLQALFAASGERAGVRVLNRGIDGERSGQLRARIDKALAESTPAVVLITTGGNDLLRRGDPAQTRANLDAIVAQVRAAGAWPVVFAVPKPSLAAAAGFGSDHPLYEELAEAGESAVIGGVVAGILADESLRSDEIHPNAAGYGLMAQAAWTALQNCD